MDYGRVLNNNFFIKGFHYLWYTFLSLNKIPIEKVIHSLSYIYVSYLILVLILQIIMFYINAIQFWIFTEKQLLGFSIHHLIKINLITQFYKLVLPGDFGGGLVMWLKLSKKNNISFFKLYAS